MPPQKIAPRQTAPVRRGNRTFDNPVPERRNARAEAARVRGALGTAVIHLDTAILTVRAAVASAQGSKVVSDEFAREEVDLSEAARFADAAEALLDDFKPAQ